jgi:hypothetical protein
VVKTLPIAQPEAPYAEGNHQHAHADHDAERPEDDKGVWPILFRKIFQRRDLLIQAMGEDQAAKRRDLQPVFGALFIHIRHAKQQQRGGFAGFVFPVAFNGSDFCRLMFKRVEPCISPTIAWTGATSSAIHIAMENILRMAGVSLPRRRCQAAEAPTNIALLRKRQSPYGTDDTGKKG